ncbi:secretagogin isoform X2 [Siphateles boraxobius]|uniref:secretagogin isoform X2 n=1 Tax=Siphateles boraxobius TaxID=180520 RepID=UPI004062A01F
MDCAFANLDAAGFLQIWQHFDADDNGYIEGKELDDFFLLMLKKLGPEDKITKGSVQQIKKRFMSAYDVTSDGRLQIEEMANMILPEDENFLLIFRREALLDNSVEFMKIWRKHDADSSGYISAVELRGFLKDLFEQHKKNISPNKLEEYTDTMMNIFDKNKDGRLDLNDLARGFIQSPPNSASMRPRQGTLHHHFEVRSTSSSGRTFITDHRTLDFDRGSESTQCVQFRQIDSIDNAT